MEDSPESHPIEELSGRHTDHCSTVDDDVANNQPSNKASTYFDEKITIPKTDSVSW